MGDRVTRPRLLIAASLAALAAGVGTAVLVSAATAVPGNKAITLIGENQKVLTIYGSDFADKVTVRGDVTSNIIVVSENGIDNMRTDCTTGDDQTSYCQSPETRTITAPLNDGPDSLTFEDRLQGVTIYGAGSDGRDRIGGGPGPQSLTGGKGDDNLGGGSGDDDLTGGPDDDDLHGGTGHDACDGGPGRDHVAGCE